MCCAKRKERKRIFSKICWAFFQWFSMIFEHKKSFRNFYYDSLLTDDYHQDQIDLIKRLKVYNLRKNRAQLCCMQLNIKFTLHSHGAHGDDLILMCSWVDYKVQNNIFFDFFKAFINCNKNNSLSPVSLFASWIVREHEIMFNHARIIHNSDMRWWSWNSS